MWLLTSTCTAPNKQLADALTGRRPEGPYRPPQEVSSARREPGVAATEVAPPNVKRETEFRLANDVFRLNAIFATRDVWETGTSTWAVFFLPTW
jgi:hypothetical protein